MNAPIPYIEAIPFSDLQKMAGAIAASGLFGMKDEKQALGLMLTAQAEGQHPATITQDYDIIQGKATRKTHSVLARYQQAGGSIEWHSLTDELADATFSPPPSAGRPLRMTWTLVMARNAGLEGKDNWKRYPRAMLRARCIAEGVRATFPAAIGGMLLAEEAQDMDIVQGEVVGKTIEHVIEGPKAKSESAAASGNDQTNVVAGAAPEASAVPRGDPKDEPKLSPGAKETLKKQMVNAGRTETDLIAAGFQKIDDMAFANFNDAVTWLKKNPAKA